MIPLGIIHLIVEILESDLTDEEKKRQIQIVKEMWGIEE